MDGAGSGAFRRFIIPLLIVQHMKGRLHLLNLSENRFPLLLDEREPLVNGGVALYAPIHKAFDFFDGHTRLLEALNDMQPAEIFVLEHPNAAAGALHKGKQSLLVIISQGMEKFIPFEKLSKKKQREQNAKRRGSWYGLSPVTRKPENSRSYNRRKARKWSDDSMTVPFVILSGRVSSEFHPGVRFERLS